MQVSRGGCQNGAAEELIYDVRIETDSTESQSLMSPDTSLAATVAWSEQD